MIKIVIGSLKSNVPMFAYSQCNICGHQEKELIPNGGDWDSSGSCAKCGSQNRKYSVCANNPTWWKP